VLTRSARSAAKADGEAEPEAGVDAEEKAEPEPEPTVTAMPISALDDGLAIAPIIGIATTLAIAGAIWLLMRSLGKRACQQAIDFKSDGIR
jgi:hypothetical protein